MFLEFLYSLFPILACMGVDGTYIVVFFIVFTLIVAVLFEHFFDSYCCVMDQT